MYVANRVLAAPLLTQLPAGGRGAHRAVPCWLSPCRATRGQLVPLFHSSLRAETHEMESLLKNDVFKEV